MRGVTDPRCSAPVVVAFCLASYAAVFAAAWALVGWLVDRARG